MNSLPAFFPSAKRKPVKPGIFFPHPQRGLAPDPPFPIGRKLSQNPAGLLNSNLFYVEFFSSNLAIFTRFLKVLFFGEKKAAFCFTFFSIPPFSSAFWRRRFSPSRVRSSDSAGTPAPFSAFPAAAGPGGRCRQKYCA